MIDAIKDLAALTTIPYEKLSKLAPKLGLIIVDILDEQSKLGNDIIDIDIGIGTLQLINRDVLEYRFIPSKDLEGAIMKYFENGVNPLQDIFEQKLANRFIKVYKEVI